MRAFQFMYGGNWKSSSFSRLPRVVEYGRRREREQQLKRAFLPESRTTSHLRVSFLLDRKTGVINGDN